MVAGMAAPAYAGTYYIGDGDITITKDEKGDVYVKHADNKDKSNGDVDNGDIIIKGGKRSEDTTAPGGSSSEGGTPATSAAKSASATLKVEDSENEDKDMVYPGDTKGGDSSDGSGEENENQSTEKDQTGDTTGSSDGTSGSGGTKADPKGGGEENAPQPSGTSGSEGGTKAGGTPTTGSKAAKSGTLTGSGTPAEGTESTESNRSAPESQFTYTGASLNVADANDDEETPTESTTALETAADNFKAAAQNVIRIINKLVSNESTGKDNTLNVTLDNVNIDTSSSKTNNAALSVEGAGDTKITLVGDNKLTSGIHSDGDLTISGNAHIVSATGGNGDSSNSRSDAGDGIRAGTLTISGEARIDNATGGTADSGSAGDGIYNYGKLTIKDNAKIGTVKGGDATASGKDGGYGIRNHGQFTMSGGTITNAVGGMATGRTGDGGDGIYCGDTLTIEGGEIQQTTGGTATGHTGDGGYGIRSNVALTIKGGKIEQTTGGDATGESGTGGSGIGSNGTLTIKGGEIQQTTGGEATGKSGGDGIGSYGALTIFGSAKIETAQGGASTNGNGGSGISSGGILTIEGSANIGTAQGGASTNGTGGDGIHSGSVVKISGDTITKATGGNATGESGTGGHGIRSKIVKILGGIITKAKGGNATGEDGDGGAGIASDGTLTIHSVNIGTAQGGASTNGNGGSGISSGGILTIEGSANIGTAQGGASTNGTGGDGIHSGSVVKISGDTITKATGGNATGENSTGGSGIVGSFVNVAGGTINTTGGSGKSGGAGVSTESGIVSIGNSDTPLDLTATAPDADNAIRGRDGKKLDEIIHLEENGKRGLVKLVENGVTRLFHNGVYTKTALPDFSGSETHPLGEWVTTTKPTCTEPGKKQRSCTVKDCVVTETEELPALGHQWSGWTPVEGGSREYRICAVCNAVEYRDVSHNSGFIIPTNLRVLDSTQTDILQNAQLVRLNQINDVLYIDVALETASLQGVLSDLTGLRSENIETVVFSTERCTSTLSLSDVAALGAGDTPFTLSHSGSTATFTVGGADHSALLR